MRIRYFAAAAAAAGVREETVELGLIVPDGGTLGALVSHLSGAHPAVAAAPGATKTAPSLARVLARSSFLVNEVNVRDAERKLRDGDVVDILPPFAGG